jgi:hypothetical protein
MIKSFLLTSIVVCLCCFVSKAQQDSDSTGKEHGLADGTDSLFANFSYISKDGNKIVLQWSGANTPMNDYFIIERSEDGNSYETIGAIKGSQTDNQYEVGDNSSLTASNFYRIKYIKKSGETVYSKSLEVNAHGNIALKFYPNPVDKLLIVETNYKVDIQLINTLGTVKLSKQLQQGLQVIDVSSLDKGNYILRIVDNERNRSVLQQLVKN